MGKHSAKPKYEWFSCIKEPFGSAVPWVAIVSTCTLMAVAINETINEPLAEGRAAVSSQFVRTCGAAMCRGSAIFNPLPRVVCSDELSNPSAIVAAARGSNQNTIEIGSLVAPSQEDDEELIAEGTWKKIDAVIAQAEKERYPVILNLGDFVTRRSVNDEQISSITEWKNFLTFISNRPNSITHRVYTDDKTIMAIDLDPAPECSNQKFQPTYNYEQVGSLAQKAFPDDLIIMKIPSN